ncbi:MAG: monovalent cation/H(+) antiporter subunit G [Anaerolineae bacterium]|nr:monovalent cation/H(+) antiporter subunit G [Anaerolineae bacterium]
MIAEVLGAIFIVIGVVFSALGVVGILRLPDTYSRLHASGKTSTLGVLFICLGTAFLRPSAILELLALSIFIIFSGPVGSHAIAAAVHRGTEALNEESQEQGKDATTTSGVHRNIKEYLPTIADTSASDTQ